MTSTIRPVRPTRRAFAFSAMAMLLLGLHPLSPSAAWAEGGDNSGRGGDDSSGRGGDGDGGGRGGDDNSGPGGGSEGGDSDGSGGQGGDGSGGGGGEEGGGDSGGGQGSDGDVDGGGGSGGDGNGGGGGSGRGQGDGGTDSASKGGNRATDADPDRSARAPRDITVRYADGWVERIVGGHYELIDDQSRSVVRRSATAKDFSRMKALR